MAWETVNFDVSDHIARVALNRPESHNTMTTQLIQELDEAMKQADADPDVRVIILVGEGRSFSAGHDLSGRPKPQLPGGPTPGSVDYRLDYEDEYYYQANLNIRNLHTPTIAGLRGHVVLGGLMTALMCDLVIAEESTNIWNPSVRHTGTGGEIMILPWDIGVRRTKELLWTGDPLDVHEAHRLGLLNRVVPDGTLEAECRRLAERIALMPPRAVSLTKRSLNKLEEIQGMLQAFEHHFLVHQLGHVTEEAAQWAQEAATHRAQGGFKAWLAFRDGPFKAQAKKEY